MPTDVPKLIISPNFTMDDIRAIRTYNYEMTKNMTSEERCAYYDKICKEGREWFHQSKKEYVLENENISIAAEPELEYKTKNQN
jgi:hypothetical protein